MTTTRRDDAPEGGAPSPDTEPGAPDWRALAAAARNALKPELAAAADAQTAPEPPSVSSTPPPPAAPQASGPAPAPAAAHPHNARTRHHSGHVKIEYGPIDPVLADRGVTEVMINGHDQIWVEVGGRLHRTTLAFESEDALMRLIDGIAAYVGRRINMNEATLDARLPDGSRVNVVLPPLSLTGPVVTIRRFPEEALTDNHLIELGSAPRSVFDFLHALVVSRRSILLSGRTGSGKTTVLNVLSGWIPDTERIISIEDSAELQLRKPHWIRMETRQPDTDGRFEATARDLVRNTLRMRPDRIIVGEVRGREAFDMLTAMNTGHDGSMSTIHANSPRDALARLETLVLMAGLDIPQRVVRDLIASAIHVIIHLDRTDDGGRRIACVSEIVGREGEVVTMQDIFTIREVREKDGVKQQLMLTGVRPRSLDAMVPVRHLLPQGLMRVWPDPRLFSAPVQAN
ncbi:MAG TPA: CpaF family protein [Candidatus Dormibacteraeota bacterium]|nr:CpaF family protein [Candidatus Dormibacteraeota bacterium]